MVISIKCDTSYDIETNGLDSRKNKIVLIGIKKRRIKQWKMWKIKDEMKMTFEFIEAVKRVAPDEMIVG